jgi:hypothetical protein
MTPAERIRHLAGEIDNLSWPVAYRAPVAELEQIALDLLDRLAKLDAVAVAALPFTGPEFGSLGDEYMAVQALRAALYALDEEPAP